MAIASLDMLHHALAYHAPLVMAFTVDGQTLSFPSSFVKEQRECFWIAEPPEMSSFADVLIRSRANVMIAFRNDLAKVMLTTTLAGRQAGMDMGNGIAVNVLQVDYPTELDAVQRRAHYRVHVPDNSGLGLRIWKMAPGDSLRQLPKPSAELPAMACDLSIGGLRAMLLPRLAVRPEVDQRERLRVEITYREHTVLVEGRIRLLRKDILSGNLVVGVQFAAGSADVKWNQACQKLSLIVGQLQRQELRLLWDGLEPLGKSAA